jgi:hypothetical protein
MRTKLGMLATVFALTACGESAPDEGNAGWRGETPHVDVRGSINGESVAISLDGEAVASTTSAWCGREYAAPTLESGELDFASARIATLEVGGYATVNGEERSFELELKEHPFVASEVGTRFSIVPRVDGVAPPANGLWLDWEWHTVDGEDLYESSAQEGTFSFGQFTGTPAPGTTVIPEGTGAIGGFVQARWSLDEALDISFSVPCTRSDVEAE